MVRNRVGISGLLVVLSVLGTGCEDCGDPKIEPATLHEGTVGESYRAELHVTCYDGGWKLLSGELPPGIQFDDRGVFSGTPTLEGTYVFTVGTANEGSDEEGRTDVSRGYSLEILGPGAPNGSAGSGG